MIFIMMTCHTDSFVPGLATGGSHQNMSLPAHETPGLLKNNIPGIVRRQLLRLHAKVGRPFLLSGAVQPARYYCNDECQCYLTPQQTLSVVAVSARRR